MGVIPTLLKFIFNNISASIKAALVKRLNSSSFKVTHDFGRAPRDFIMQCKYIMCTASV